MWSLNNDLKNMVIISLRIILKTFEENSIKSPGAPAPTAYDVGLRSGQVDKVIFFLST
jgi:hypothetical protein